MIHVAFESNRAHHAKLLWLFVEGAECRIRFNSGIACCVPASGNRRKVKGRQDEFCGILHAIADRSQFLGVNGDYGIWYWCILYVCQRHTSGGCSRINDGPIRNWTRDGLDNGWFSDWQFCFRKNVHKNCAGNDYPLWTGSRNCGPLGKCLCPLGWVDFTMESVWRNRIRRNWERPDHAERQCICNVRAQGACGERGRPFRCGHCGFWRRFQRNARLCS